jgi:hypothetical protein
MPESRNYRYPALLCKGFKPFVSDLLKTFVEVVVFSVLQRLP